MLRKSSHPPPPRAKKPSNSNERTDGTMAKGTFVGANLGGKLFKG